jgi:predicted patatin/cPLA2 family phospholipase
MEEVPVFVKVEDYKDVLKNIEELKNKIAIAKDLIVEIHKIKEEEENELETWKIGLNDVEQKIENLSSLLKQ